MLTVFMYERESGAYAGPQQLGINDLDPRSPGTVLVPGNATIVPPPRCGVGLWPFWIDGRWQVYEEIVQPKPIDPFASDYYANL